MSPFHRSIDRPRKARPAHVTPESFGSKHSTCKEVRVRFGPLEIGFVCHNTRGRIGFIFLRDPRFRAKNAETWLSFAELALRPRSDSSPIPYHFPSPARLTCRTGYGKITSAHTGESHVESAEDTPFTEDTGEAGSCSPARRGDRSRRCPQALGPTPPGMENRDCPSAIPEVNIAGTEYHYCR